MLFGILLRNVIKKGHLIVYDAHGHCHEFGETSAPDSVTIRLHSAKLHWKLALNPRLYIGEAYTDGTLTVEDGSSIYDFLALVIRNTAHREVSALDKWNRRYRYVMRKFAQANPVKRARENVAHHYDLSGALYDLFLDPRRQYSCAYFADPSMSLEQAQLAKLDHITAKLLLKPEHKVLDIGCGWGGLAMHIAETTGARVTGITLSEEQHAYAVAKAKERGLENQVSFHLRDYRNETGTYDRIVSVGMFEHVGVPNYDTFFNTVRDRLTPDGAALIHFIVQSATPWPTNPWMTKYIFPGGYSPGVSEAVTAVEQSGLWTTDLECLRLHYAMTLRCWRNAFVARWNEAAKLYDERFCRMWEFYLAGCEVGFRYDTLMVAQFQLARERDAVPLTRDYLYRVPAADTAATEAAYRPRRVA